MIVPTLELIGSDVQIADLSPYGKSVWVLFCSLLNRPRDGTDPSSCPPLAACPAEGRGQFAGRFAPARPGALVTFNYIFCHAELQSRLSSLKPGRGKERI